MEPLPAPLAAALAAPVAPAEPAAARLLIHTEGPVAAAAKEPWSPLQWLLAWAPTNLRQDPHAPLRLQIDDLQNHPFLTLDDAGPLVDVVLPAGTYHVAVQRGDVRRGYTMTLAQGASVELYLRLAPDPL